LLTGQHSPEQINYNSNFIDRTGLKLHPFRERNISRSGTAILVR